MRSSLSDRDFSITADTSAAVLDVVLPPQRNPDFLSTKVVRQAPSFFPMTVSPSQSPRRDLFWAFWGRMSDRDLSFPLLSVIPLCDAFYRGVAGDGTSFGHPQSDPEVQKRFLGRSS